MLAFVPVARFHILGMSNAPPHDAARFTRILLVRHGETAANAKMIIQGSRLDCTLNEKGISDAVALGYSIRSANNRFCCASSALARARQTALLVTGDRRDMDNHVCVQGLNEIDYGSVWDGRSLKEHFDDVRSLAMRWRKGETHVRCPHGGESPDDVLLRSKRALFALVDERKADVVVVVAHNFVNKILLSHFLFGSIRYMHLIDQDNTCVNIIDISHDKEKVRVRTLNDVSHLSSAQADKSRSSI